ncbi:MAG: hypothetical protein ABSD29_19560 [Verrucomicrobiota bacterium]|jgi:type I site-specific restriction endonuclease
MPTEADTCRKLVVPKLQAAGWDDEPHSVGAQRVFTRPQLLTPDLAPLTCRNVVLVRLINSMVEFKQTIGRGTRVRDNYGKLWFNGFHYTAEKVQTLFASPDELRARWTDAAETNSNAPAKREFLRRCSRQPHRLIAARKRL